jgi:hypothetical protein
MEREIAGLFSFLSLFWCLRLAGPTEEATEEDREKAEQQLGLRVKVRVLSSV